MTAALPGGTHTMAKDSSTAAPSSTPPTPPTAKGVVITGVHQVHQTLRLGVGAERVVTTVAQVAVVLIAPASAGGTAMAPAAVAHTSRVAAVGRLTVTSGTMVGGSGINAVQHVGTATTWSQFKRRSILLWSKRVYYYCCCCNCSGENLGTGTVLARLGLLRILTS